MPSQRIITRRHARNAAWLLLALILIVGLINVPFAISRYRSRLNWLSTPTISQTHFPGDYTWPSATPHVSPWPRPDIQEIRGNFGCRLYSVRANVDSGVPDDPHLYSMQVQRLGWPLPVIEQKQMWWPSKNPALAGVESDPAPFILWPGLILNALIVGGSAWLIIITITLMPIAFKRWRRHQRRQCLACGYPVGQNPVCTECGDTVNPRYRSGADVHDARSIAERCVDDRGKARVRAAQRRVSASDAVVESHVARTPD